MSKRKMKNYDKKYDNRKHFATINRSPVIYTNI